ncbi:hypothetical protein SPI_04826 [Niveomyces insectorum RCEF 264]|uniref:Uncharacterized protein n=1 Tax=Niveomyces insectorum RCEF 264 TaxID=1081102 RepID=A0A167UW55_9HYPO|nr:hypothetical protein SPI_04826 [Niveomyces insectorum RCEF 264]
MGKSETTNADAIAGQTGGMPTTASSLPSYTQAIVGPAPSSPTTALFDDVVQPAVLVLTNQTIHAESEPSVPLYEVSRGVAQLGSATSVVEFKRMEKRSGNGTAQLRPRHVYNLRHVQTLARLLSAPYAEYFVEAVAAPSRRLGHLGLKNRRVLGHVSEEHYAVLPVDMKGWTERDQPPFEADAKPLFESHRRQDGSYKWTDGAGLDVALEYSDTGTEPRTGADPAPRLVVTAPLPRASLDALVALWCCRLWQQSVGRQPGKSVRTGYPLQMPTFGYSRTRFE